MSKIVKLSGRSSQIRVIAPSMTVESKPIADFVQNRVFPRQVGTGAMRGTQLVGNTGTMIDAANNRIVLTSSDGSTVGIGTIPGSTTDEFGFFATDADGTLVMKIVNGTRYIYDADTGINVMQDGKVAPSNANSFYGYAVAPEGEDVEDADEFA